MSHHKITFTGDEHALNGAWSPPTSRANFCEEDYSVTAYVAEFINTLSNLIYVYYAIRHIRSNSRGADFMSVSLLILGICSFLFHLTLLLPLEYGDELSMLGLVWSLFQGILTVHSPDSSAAHRRWNKVINVSLSVFFPLFAAFYVWSADVGYHSFVFIGTLVLVILRTLYLLYGPATPGFPRGAKRNEWAKRSAKIFVVLISGFVIWSIDLRFCAELRALRKQLGLPWAWIFELHGWWHVLTGVSAAWFMEIIREMKGEVNKGKSKAK